MITLIIFLTIVANSVSHIHNHIKLKESSEDRIILKCCEPGYAFSFKDMICVQNGNPFHLEHIKKNINPMLYFDFYYRKPTCSETENRVIAREFYDETISLRVDCHGNLHIDTERQANDKIFGPESFCVENLLLENYTTTWTIFNAIICIKPNTIEYHIINSACMIISCIFILVTVMVYIWLPELNNQHGRILIAYLICLFIGYSLLATMKMLLYFNKISKTRCFGLSSLRFFLFCMITVTYFLVPAIVVYFFLLATFFWQNIMCFDIWQTFSGTRGLMTNRLIVRDKFCSYLPYAFGIPTILTSLLISMEYYPLSTTSILPVRTETCFLSGTNRFIYLYSPMLVLWVADMTFFILTIAKILQIKKQTSLLYTGDSSTHSRHNIEKQRLFVYIKLFIVMGINWILEVVSAHAAPDNTIWLYTDACNELIGLLIFIIFVCKRKTFRLMKKRYAQIIGEPVVRNQSSTRTTNTSVKITNV